MHTNNSLPMLGTLTPNRWGRRHMRNDRPTGAYARLEIRAARLDGRRLVADEIDAYFADLDAGVQQVELDALADDEVSAWIMEDNLHAAALEAAGHDGFDVWTGGFDVWTDADLETISAAGAAPVVDARYVLDDEDLPGWGSGIDYFLTGANDCIGDHLSDDENVGRVVGGYKVEAGISRRTGVRKVTQSVHA